MPKKNLQKQNEQKTLVCGAFTWGLRGVVWLEILVIRLSVFFRLFTYFRFAVGNSQLAQLKSCKTVGRLLASYLHTLNPPLSPLV